MNIFESPAFYFRARHDRKMIEQLSIDRVDSTDGSRSILNCSIKTEVTGSNPGWTVFLLIWEFGILIDPVPSEIISEKKCGFQDTLLEGIVITSARSD